MDRSSDNSWGSTIREMEEFNARQPTERTGGLCRLRDGKGRRSVGPGPIACVLRLASCVLRRASAVESLLLLLLRLDSGWSSRVMRWTGLATIQSGEGKVDRREWGTQRECHREGEREREGIWGGRGEGDWA